MVLRRNTSKLTAKRSVLIFCRNSYGQTGGISTKTEKLALSLAERGWRVELAYPAEDFAVLGEGLVKRVTIPVRFFDAKMSAEGLVSSILALANVVRLSLYLRRSHIDRVIAFFLDEAALLLAVAGRLSAKRVVVCAVGSDIHSHEPSSRRKHFLRALHKIANIVVVKSDAMARLFCDQTELGSKCRAVPVVDGVDLDFWRPSLSDAWEDAPKSILAVGALRDVKDFPTLLGAFAILRQSRRDVRLDIAGDGLRRNELKALAQELDIEDAVVWHGNVSPRGLVDLYQRAWISVVASSREGGPHVVLESLACGTPVLSTPVGNVPEYMKGNTEWRFEVGDSQRLAILLNRWVCLSVDARKVEGRTARNSAARFDWSDSVTQYEEALSTGY